jgi:hypothetical protein
MNKRAIRYRKPEWHNWVFIQVEESEVAEKVAQLEALGYIVEK